MVLKGKELEEFYLKKFPRKTRGLDIGYLNFVLTRFGKGKVLDVGCGFGELIEALRAFGFDVSGLTVTGLEVKECKEKGLNVVLGDAGKELPFESNSFDIVLSIGSIEHIENWENAMKEMSRVLKTGGRILIETPNKSVFRNSKKYKEKGEDIDVVHFKEFNYKELLELLEKNNLSNIKSHNKIFFYPRYYALSFLDIDFFNKKHPYLFLSAVKK
ncbi:MAG: class I SAM-dependent methyltransferase [archaeon]